MYIGYPQDCVNKVFKNCVKVIYKHTDISYVEKNINFPPNYSQYFF